MIIYVPDMLTSETENTPVILEPPKEDSVALKQLTSLKTHCLGNASPLLPIVIKALQEQQTQIHLLEKKLYALKNGTFFE